MEKQLANKQFRFHVLGVPHTQTHPAWSGCAFTQKALKFCRMMTQRGHTVIHYGHEHSEVECTESVTVTTNRDLRTAYGDAYVDDQAWKIRGFGSYYAIDDHAHLTFHANAIKEIAKRKQPLDFVLHFWGLGTEPVAHAHPDLINVEPGIGNGSGFARWRVYESHTVRNAVGGIAGVNYCTQDWYHVVIPNYFDLADFDYSESKSDYILYLGRIYDGKGVDIAIEATAKAGKRLIIAGQGSLKDMGYTCTPDHVVEHGYATPEQRRHLLSNAQALFIASRYGEPFAGVQVEAWLSGTPVISPDWAAFAELNRHNITGIRCRTFRDFVEACDTAQYLLPIQCRKHGEQFSLENVAPEYERYFQDVMNVYTGAGWYQI
jgi:glycosyltransferase involved in cell wall biosynthesis